MKIIVNKKCINKATRKSKYACPVALAIQKIYPYKPVCVYPCANGEITRCDCGCDGARIGINAVVEIPLKNGNRVTLNLPDYLCGILELWDEDGEIEPFSFDLPELDRYLTRKK